MPARADQQQSNWSASGATKDVVMAGCGVGDLLVAKGVAADGASTLVFSTFSGTTSAWTVQATVGAGGFSCRGTIATATVSTAGSITVRATASPSIEFGAQVVRYAAGTWTSIGDVTSKHATGSTTDELDNSTGTNQTVNAMSTTSANSSIELIAGDWSANATNPTAGERQEATAGTLTYETYLVGNGVTYGVHGGVYADSGAAGSKTVGFTTIRTPTVVALEIIGASTSSAPSPAKPVFFNLVGTPVQSPFQLWGPPRDISAVAVSGLLLKNNFEGGSNGSNVTPGTTGGTGNTAVDVVNIPTGATVIFDNTHARGGTLGVKVQTSTTAGRAAVGWTTSVGTQTVVYMRVYVYVTGLVPPGPFLMRALTGNSISGGTSRAAVVYDSATGKLILWDSSGTAIAGMTTTNALATNAWNRVEVKLTLSSSAAAGSCILRLFNGANLESTTPTEEVSNSGTANLGGSADSFGYGIMDTDASVGPYWIDDIGLSTTDWVGPEGAAGPDSITLGAIASGETFSALNLQDQITLGDIASGEALTALTYFDAITLGAIASGEALSALNLQDRISLGAIASGETFSALSVAEIITLGGIASAEALSPLSLLDKMNLTGIASAENVPALNLQDRITLSGIASAEAVVAINLQDRITLVGITSGEVVATLLLTDIINLSGIASAENVPPLVMGSTDQINLSGIASGEAFTALLLTDLINLAGIATGEAVSPLKLTDQISLVGIASDENVPAVFQSTIVLQGIPSGEIVAAVTLTEPGVTVVLRDKTLRGYGL